MSPRLLEVFLACLWRLSWSRSSFVRLLADLVSHGVYVAAPPVQLLGVGQKL